MFRSFDWLFNGNIAFLLGWIGFSMTTLVFFLTDELGVLASVEYLMALLIKMLKECNKEWEAAREDVSIVLRMRMQ